MRWLYSLLLLLLLPLVLLSFVWRARYDRGYLKRWGERFGGVPAAMQPGGIVLHAVSVGEVVAAAPLVEQLLTSYPALPLTVTCTTPTGSARLLQQFGGRVQHCYLPFDLPVSNRRFLQRLQPRLVVVMETELWPNLLTAARQQQIPVVVANARLSKRSAKGYRRFYWLTRLLLPAIRLLLAQDQTSLRRFRALGLDARAGALAGNLKYELALPANFTDQQAQLAPAFSGREVWVAASTHAGEDELLLQAFQTLQTHLPELLLVLVPRHPDRFSQVANLVQKQGLRLSRRSVQGLPSTDSQVFLADSMGELLHWYALADVVFVGGSLIERGGHNPLEAMAFGKSVLSGPHVFNFSSLFRQLERQQLVSYASTAVELEQQVLQQFANQEQRLQAGQRARHFFSQHSGAARRSVALIGSHLPGVNVPMKQHQDKQNRYWYNPDFFQQISAEQFAPAYWQQQQAALGQANGRSTVWFVRQGEHELVLRHYYRGGLIGKLNKDKFLREPTLASRAIREFRLLADMHAQGLPVPRPAAARMRRHGLFYSADILVERIPNSTDLAQLLHKERALSVDEWREVGRVIARLHQLQIYHSDLNCHNILLDTAGKVWLIDFDKCGPRSEGPWKQQNLDRLLRSLTKEKSKLSPFHWQPADWQPLLAGYQEQLQGQSSAA